VAANNGPSITPVVQRDNEFAMQETTRSCIPNRFWDSSIGINGGKNLDHNSIQDAL
jgi:hypothetical protein